MQEEMGRALMHMVNQLLGMAWNQWRDDAAEASLKMRKMMGGLHRMLMRQLSMAWEKWQAEAANGKRQEREMRGACERFLHRQLSFSRTRTLRFQSSLSSCSLRRLRL